MNRNFIKMTPFEHEEPKTGFNKALAVLAAIVLTGAVIAGYFYMRWRYSSQNPPKKIAAAEETKPTIPPKATIFVDEAMIKGPSVVIGGTVKNISKETLTAISIELELFKRKNSGSEKRIVVLEPKDLAPGQTGRYSITISSKEFEKTKISRFFSTADNSEIAFNTDDGAKRPPEKPTASKPKVIIEKPKSSSGDGFYNTPDAPVVIK